MPAGFICLPAPSPSTGQYTCTTEAPPPTVSSPPFFPECCSHSLSSPSFFFTPPPPPPPPSFLTSLTFTQWSLCHFLNNDPGAEGTTAYLYFIMVSPSPAGLGDQAVWGSEGGGERDRETEWKREREGEREGGDRSSSGVFAHGVGEGGGCSSIMTDTSTDVTIRAQSKHINDQPMAPLS